MGSECQRGRGGTDAQAGSRWLTRAASGPRGKGKGAGWLGLGRCCRSAGPGERNGLGGKEGHWGRKAEPASQAGPRGEGSLAGPLEPKAEKGRGFPFLFFCFIFISKPFQNSFKSIRKYFDFAPNHTIQ